MRQQEMMFGNKRKKEKARSRLFRPGSMKAVILRRWNTIPMGLEFEREALLKQCQEMKYGMITTYNRRLNELQEEGHINYFVPRDGYITKIRIEGDQNEPRF